MSSIFGFFIIVKLGIYATQEGLDMIGNNIISINTDGHICQRLDRASLTSGGSDRCHSQCDVRVRQDVLVSDISQLWDLGLDISYRRSQADVGLADS